MNKQTTECPTCKPSKIEFFHKDKKISEFTNPKCTECGGDGWMFSKEELEKGNPCIKIDCNTCKGTTETTLEERFEFTMYDLRGEWANELVKKELLYQLNTKLVVKIALAVQQRDEEILQKAKDILDKESEYYGTDKHGLSYEQLEYIINATNQDHDI